MPPLAAWGTHPSEAGQGPGGLEAAAMKQESLCPEGLRPSAPPSWDPQVGTSPPTVHAEGHRPPPTSGWGSPFHDACALPLTSTHARPLRLPRPPMCSPVFSSLFHFCGFFLFPFCISVCPLSFSSCKLAFLSLSFLIPPYSSYPTYPRPQPT